MKKRIYTAIGIFVLFFALLGLLCLWAEVPASQVRSSVLRFHVVANSDSDTDQQNKFAVRDGIANLCAKLFENSQNKQDSMDKAIQNKALIESTAEEILRQRGSAEQVTVAVRKRFFPTRHYEGVSLPAGVYDTIDVQIGKAQGKNFWCVMFPAICLGTSSEINKEMIENTLPGDAAELVTKDTPKVKFKFKLVEILQNFKNLW